MLIRASVVAYFFAHFESAECTAVNGIVPNASPTYEDLSEGATMSSTREWLHSVGQNGGDTHFYFNFVLKYVIISSIHTNDERTGLQLSSPLSSGRAGRSFLSYGKEADIPNDDAHRYSSDLATSLSRLSASQSSHTQEKEEQVLTIRSVHSGRIEPGKSTILSSSDVYLDTK